MAKNNNSAAALIKSGKKLLKQSDYDGAITDFQKALALSGEAPFSIYMLLSAAYREKGDNKNSIKHCNKAIETYELIHADDYEKAMAIAYNDLALTYMAMNKKKKAADYYKLSADNGGKEALEKLKELDVEYKDKYKVRKAYGASSVSHD